MRMKRTSVFLGMSAGRQIVVSAAHVEHTRIGTALADAEPDTLCAGWASCEVGRGVRLSEDSYILARAGEPDANPRVAGWLVCGLCILGVGLLVFGHWQPV